MMIDIFPIADHCFFWCWLAKLDSWVWFVFWPPLRLIIFVTSRGRSLLQFSLSGHNFQIETGRCRGVERSLRVCIRCSRFYGWSVVVDELHLFSEGSRTPIDLYHGTLLNIVDVFKFHTTDSTHALLVTDDVTIYSLVGLFHAVGTSAGIRIIWHILATFVHAADFEIVTDKLFVVWILLVFRVCRPGFFRHFHLHSCDFQRWLQCSYRSFEVDALFHFLLMPVVFFGVVFWVFTYLQALQTFSVALYDEWFLPCFRQFSGKFSYNDFQSMHWPNICLHLRVFLPHCLFHGA